MTTILDLPIETRADLAESVARLFALIHPAPPVADAVLDGLQRVSAWARQYLLAPDVATRHFVQDAGDDLEQLARTTELGELGVGLVSAALRVCAIVGRAAPEAGAA